MLSLEDISTAPNEDSGLKVVRGKEKTIIPAAFVYCQSLTSICDSCCFLPSQFLVFHCLWFLSTSLCLKTSLSRRCLPQWQSFPPENPILCQPSGSGPSDRFQMVVQCCRHRDLCNVEYVPTLASRSGECIPPPEKERKEQNCPDIFC